MAAKRYNSMYIDQTDQTDWMVDWNEFKQEEKSIHTAMIEVSRELRKQGYPGLAFGKTKYSKRAFKQR